MANERQKAVLDAFDKAFRVVAYCTAAWVFLDILKTLPPEIADRVINALLKKLGI